ncbi:MAG: response regulator [Planctomycetes bacterium]|nr:response regulator [Planctomycetota bacterium]
MSPKPARVLVCDDERFVLEVVLAALEAGGYEAVGFEDPRAALSAFQAAPQGFDLAIIDRRLPHQDGLGVVAALRAQRPDLPVIVASGARSHGESWPPFAGPAPSVLDKPFRPSALLAAVANALGRTT